mmetsp:Transcript_31374/g.57596  ORF Transcript_31374/g.57596 Transcript_31374/m.57596 type:complete len:393 (-) Transcript_31374:35-1213(-)
MQGAVRRRFSTRLHGQHFFGRRWWIACAIAIGIVLCIAAPKAEYVWLHLAKHQHRPHPQHQRQDRLWRPDLSRRQMMHGAGSGIATVAWGAPGAASSEVFPTWGTLSDRLKPGIAELRNPRLGPLAPPVPSRSAYPDWLFGEWQVRSRQKGFAELLEAKFLQEDIREALRTDDGKVLEWKSRYYVPAPEELDPELNAPSTPLGTSTVAYEPIAASKPLRPPPLPLASEVAGRSVVQFRAFNAAQEVQAFLGVQGLEVMAVADPRVQPVTIVVAYPVDKDDSVQTIKLRLDACGVEEDGNSFTSSELFRQVVATNGIVESVGDYEVLNRYTLVDEVRGVAIVQNRVVQYLVPGDALYDESRGRAVSLLDYEWNLTRVRSCIETPYGVQCRTQV